MTIIELSTVHSIAAIDHKTRPFCFGVITKQRTFLFQAPNSNLCQHWVSVLTLAHSKCISNNPIEKKSNSFHFSNSKISTPVAFNSLPRNSLSRSAPNEAAPLESAVNFNSKYSPSLSTSVLTAPSSVSLTEGSLNTAPTQPQGILLNPSASTPQLNVSFSLPATIPIQMATSSGSDGIFSSEEEEEDDDEEQGEELEEEEEEEEVDSPIIPSNRPQFSIESIQDSVLKQGYIHKQSSKLGKDLF